MRMVAARLPATTVISEESGIASPARPRSRCSWTPWTGAPTRGGMSPCTAPRHGRGRGAAISDIFAAGVIGYHVRRRLVWGSKGAIYEDWTLARPSGLTDLKEALVAFDSKQYRVPPPPERGWRS